MAGIGGIYSDSLFCNPGQIYDFGLQLYFFYRRIVYIVSGLGVPEGYKSTHLLEQHNKGTIVTHVLHTFTCKRFFVSITFVLVSTKDFMC
jgi:hypothetical protein